MVNKINLSLLYVEYNPNTTDLDDYVVTNILLEEEALFRAGNPEKALGKENQLRKTARLLRDARLLRPRLHGIFTLRALCQRGRAGATSVTPAMFAWLVGAAPPRPARLVCEYWLGKPPRRRRSE